MLRDNRADVFAALGDPVRLDLLGKVGDGDSITALAMELPITRQAVTRHLRVLEHAKLIQARRVGRETRFFARPARIREARAWLDQIARQWDSNLGRLKKHVENGTP